MADRKGALIHEAASPTNPHVRDDDRVRPPPACVACNAIHGGVGAERMCLRTAVLSLTDTLATLRRKYNEDIGAKDVQIARLERLLSDLNPQRPTASR
jgi:hypothetical protein